MSATETRAPKSPQTGLSFRNAEFDEERVTQATLDTLRVLIKTSDFLDISEIVKQTGRSNDSTKTVLQRLRRAGYVNHELKFKPLMMKNGIVRPTRISLWKINADGKRMAMLLFRRVLEGAQIVAERVKHKKIKARYCPHYAKAYTDVPEFGTVVIGRRGHAALVRISLHVKLLEACLYHPIQPDQILKGGGIGRFGPKGIRITLRHSRKKKNTMTLMAVVRHPERGKEYVRRYAAKKKQKREAERARTEKT